MKKLNDYCSDLNLDGVKNAIATGADVNEIDEWGNTPITNAIFSHWSHFIEMDKHYSTEEYDKLQEKAYRILEPIMNILIEHNADLNLFGENGFTPLCAAYYANSVDATRYLLEHGANPNIDCHLGDWHLSHPIYSSALQLIHEEVDDDESNPEIERLLLQYGAKLYEN